MCGIVGIDQGGDFDNEFVIPALLDRVSHRGPDGQTIRTIGRFDLALARLAITGTDTEAKILTKEGSWLLFNGELFGYPKEHDTDTHYLFELLKSCDFGKSGYGIPRIRGQFAFAFWNARQQCLVMGRDLFGERPLYYYTSGNRLAFASETKALIPLLGKNRKVDYTGIDFLETCVMDLAGAPDNEDLFGHGSMVHGIKQVPAGHLLIFNLTSAGYSAPKAHSLCPKWHTTEAAGEYRSVGDLLYNAIVERADHGNHAIGAYLSGGLDSALICCIARPKHVFTCVFDTDIGKREYEFAAKVAKRIGAKHHVVTPVVTRETIAETVYYMDGPQGTMSPVADFALAKEASKYVKAVLCGQGADELFCGYFRDLLFYTDMLLKNTYFRYIPLIDYYHGGSSAESCVPPHMWADSFLHLIKRGPVPEHIKNTVHQLATGSSSILQFVTKMEIAFTLPSLVTMNDRAAAHAGIESRSPFLDDELYQRAVCLPDEQKIFFDGQHFVTKKAIRDIARGIVPDDIIDCQEKVGLHVPMGNLFINGDDLRGPYSRFGYSEFCKNTWKNIVEGGTRV